MPNKPNADQPPDHDINKDAHKKLKLILRQEGLERCGGRSELSGIYGWVETSHLNHLRDDEFYYSIDNVVMCTPLEHYVYHLIFKNNAILIGLTEAQNEQAITSSFSRAVKYLFIHHQITFRNLPREEKIWIIHETWTLWGYYLGLPFAKEI
jgi:hypothetical protein